MKLIKKQVGAKISGRPGSSAKAAYRFQRARFSQTSLQARVGIIAIAGLFGAIFARTLHHNIFAGAGIGSGLFVAGISLMIAPEALRILAVLIVYSPISFYLGGLYSAAGSGTARGLSPKAIDYQGGSLVLFILVLLSIPIAVNFSRGKVWITLALTFGSTIFPGLIILAGVPILGLNIARLTIAVTLALRCGGWAWITGSLGLFKDSLGKKEIVEQIATVEDIEAGSEWLKRSNAEKETAKILEQLQDGHIYHDLQVKGSVNALGHLILNKSGGYLLASISTKSEYRENNKSGGNISDVPLDRVVATLLEQRRLVAKALKSVDRDFAIVIVAHGIKGEQIRKVLAVFELGDESLPSGQVILISPDILLQEVDTGFEVWNNLKVRQVSRRAYMKFNPAPAPISATEKRSPVLPHLSPIDQDGKAIIPITEVEPVALTLGTLVSINTSNGVLEGLRVAGSAYFDKKEGEMVIPLCVEKEWIESEELSRKIISYPYPTRSVFQQ
jgi:hypothetical protein